ncbi:MAG: DNA polymerase III subunit chi [Magnetococcales bacterium]|nr:DNA polymerase III subunit chi [Magnetococcales bacterium]
MPVVRFYQLAASSSEVALLGILVKILERGSRACLLAQDALQVQRLDELLWRQPADRFLAHGPWNGPDPDRQPLLLSLEPDDRNGATILVLVSPRLVADPARFDLVVDFVGKQEVALARDRYRRYQQQGCAMEYWAHSPEGRWTRQDKKES